MYIFLSVEIRIFVCAMVEDMSQRLQIISHPIMNVQADVIQTDALGYQVALEDLGTRVLVLRWAVLNRHLDELPPESQTRPGMIREDPQ